MKMKYIVQSLVLLMLAMSYSSYAQDSFVKKTSAKVDGNILATDPLGYVYVANDFELHVYDASGIQHFSYSDFVAGTISSVDAADPFKILLYYRDFGQINILDNTLSPVGEPILLRAYGLELASLVCRSYNNGIWVYDPQNFELLRLNQNMTISDRTGNLSLVTGYDIQPTFLRESENRVYLSDPDQGILVFDRYGSFYNIYPFQGIESFQISNQKIIFREEGLLKIYDPLKLLETEIKIPGSDIRDVRINFDQNPVHLYILNKTGITIFTKTE